MTTRDDLPAYDLIEPNLINFMPLAIASPDPRSQPPSTVAQDRQQRLKWQFDAQPLAWCRAMVERLRYCEQEAGYAIRMLVGRGKIEIPHHFFMDSVGTVWIDERSFDRMVSLATQVQRSTILYPAQETNGTDPDVIWLRAALDRRLLVLKETAKAVRSLYLHHVHRGSGGEAASGASPRIVNAEWWKKHLLRAVIGALGLKRWEFWPLLDSQFDESSFLFDASQPAPWSGKPVISRADQMWFRVEVAFSRPLRSDADCSEAVVDYEASAPILPPGTSLVQRVAKHFNISDLEVSQLLGLGHHLRGDSTVGLANRISYMPTTHAWELLSRFQRVCILKNQPPVRESSCEIAVALMKCGLHLSENVTFITFLSRRFNLTRESIPIYLAGVLAEHKRLHDSIPKLSPGTPPRWAVAATPNVEIFTFDQEFDYIVHLAWIEEMLRLGDTGCASKMLDSTPVARRTDPRVLALKLQVQVTLKDWPGAWEVSQHLLRVQPDNVQYLVQASEALRQLPEGGVRQAYDFLLSAPKVKQHAHEAVVRFNLARYACQLKDLNLADWWLNAAIQLELGDAWKLKALGEPDLEPLRWVTESRLSEAARASRRA